MRKYFKSNLLLIILMITFLATGCNKKDKMPEEEINILNPTEVSQETESNVDITDENQQPSINEVENSELEIVVPNTGNSDAILIKSNGHSLLIDGGDNDDEGYMVNFLKNENISKLDYMVATHHDADHIGGLDSVLNNFEVGKVFVPNDDAETKTYKDFLNSIAKNGVGSSVPLEGSKFELGNAYFEVFNTKGAESNNDSSLVIKVINGNDKMVFMGDAGKDVENKLVSKIGDVDLIKIGHHGSHSSTGESFIKALSPEYAIVTAGSQNKYGHPHKEPMDVLKKSEIEVHRSDECGDIIFKSSGNGISTECKQGSYNVGENSKYSNSSNITNKESTSSNDRNNEVVTNDENETTNSSELVYWTPSGKVYHSTKSCSTLSRSKTINEGSVNDSGKPRMCKNCGN